MEAEMESSVLTTKVVVLNPEGLHARPADLLVRTAARFAADVQLAKDGQWVDCKSILSILTLGAEQGTALDVAASGDDAGDALAAIVELFARGFYENHEPAPPA
jgi:phosphotransferase system HPr (HPr) family protein